jgi:site-specific DNA-methyltransferase (adenine-specific)
MRFLADKTRGQKVFCKFDRMMHDEENNLLCYLYLANKTFLNAHLIRTGLVAVDASMDYRWKDRFLRGNGGN